MVLMIFGFKDLGVCMRVNFVVATRLNEEVFWRDSLAGQFFRIFDVGSGEVKLFPKNTIGLSKIYNSAFDDYRHSDEVTVFMHDDLLVLDAFWLQRLLVALGQVDIVGLVGSVGGTLGQPSWRHTDLQWSVVPPERCRGFLFHGETYPRGADLSVYGRSPSRVDTLDGVFLACRPAQLPRELRFDERFLFDFYDLDFCRKARSLGLSLGVVDISALHRSSGTFGSEGWLAAYRTYIEKWEILPTVQGP